jgi:uncharacterized protein YqfA (UPF0365 family)
MNKDVILLIAVGVGLLGVLAIFVLALSMFKPWMRAMMSGAPVSVMSILGMRLRGTPPNLVIDAYIQLHMRGNETELSEVERQYIAYSNRIRTSGDLVDLVGQQATT